MVLAVVMLGVAARGGEQQPSGRGQRPATPNPQRPTGLPPSTPTQPSPSGLLIPIQAPAAPPAAKMLDVYKTVTADRLRHPDDGDWLMIRRTYDGAGYSPLSQINAANVKQLQIAWTLSTGMNNGHEAPPIVNNGAMFVATPYNQVIALDARTGQELWRYRSPSPPDARVPKPVSRGVALYGDKVFFPLGEAVLVAVDARTGKEVWRTAVEDNKKGFYMTAAPLVADGKVVVGISGGDGPTRGFVAAYDPETGKEVWRTFTIPAPGEAGSETWPAGDQWKTGGGGTWVTGNYDPETNLLFWGVGNGNPWVAEEREGDNLYTASTIAIDATTGSIKGYFQYTPNESWDWDEVSPPLLVDFTRNGRTIKGLVNFARSGYLYFLERSKDKITFVEGKPYVRQNVFRSLNPKTGRPDIDPDHRPAIGKLAAFCPSWHGAKNWQPGSYSPKTRMVYVPTQENLCAVMIARVFESPNGGTRAGTLNQMYVEPGADHISELQAWSVDTGKKAWSHPFKDSPNWGGTLATAGGLVFIGGTNDRMFRAFDASTGEVLWEQPTNSGVYAPPSSFVVDGQQYIAVVSGWGQDARSMESRINAISPGRYPEVPEGGVIWVFTAKNARMHSTAGAR
jgi:alcohol dehydrogenase (cytochrome c)